MQSVIDDVRRYYSAVGPFLDAELADRGDERFWLAAGHTARDGRILELGCGTGRVTKLLAEGQGWVLGVDVCSELLARARQRLDGRRTWLVLADMRELPLRAKFDLIVAADDPFSHLTADRDRDRALAAVRARLASGGRFVLDALWFPPDQERRRDRVATRELALEGGRVQVTEHWRCDPATQRCSTEYAYDTGIGEPTKASFEARYWTRAELSHRLSAAGLQIAHCWGGYDDQPWDEQSERLVVEARAP